MYGSLFLGISFMIVCNESWGFLENLSVGSDLDEILSFYLDWMFRETTEGVFVAKSTSLTFKKGSLIFIS